LHGIPIAPQGVTCHYDHVREGTVLPLFYDFWYMGIIIVGLLLSGLTSALVHFQFKRGKNVAISSGLSGHEVAEAILRAEGIDDVQVVEHHGFLSDHYNPSTKTLALSQPVFAGRDAAAAGVAAHEVGHAIQHARGYALLQMRSLLVPVASIGSFLGPLILMIGVGIYAAGHGQGVAITGVIIFAATTLFTLVTVPVEFDASNRARERLGTLGIVTVDEARAVRGVLMAAGLTYVAAAITSLLQLLYWAWRAGLLGGSRSDDR
jgi:uncharacterized protein